MSTATKELIKEDIRMGLTWSAYIATFGGLLFVLAFGIQQEYLERMYPTPHEWSFKTRQKRRSTRLRATWPKLSQPYEGWPGIGWAFKFVLERLEDPQIDGVGLIGQDEADPLVKGMQNTGYDLMQKSEPWRREYCAVLMGIANASEHLDGWVWDTTRSYAFPGNTVIGPSNPKPRPVRPGWRSAPKEQDCVQFLETPDAYYEKILTTKGFTEKQRVDAAISYGLWLDYKRKPDSARQIYTLAMDIATANSSKTFVNPVTKVIDTTLGPPSENMISAATALALHYARNTEVEKALQMFILVLAARKSLPEPTNTMLSTLHVHEPPMTWWRSCLSFLQNAIKTPSYPPLPSDGTAPLIRDAKQRCEEAGVMASIGEILYSSSCHEDGIAWTREAVDIVEAELTKNKENEDHGASGLLDEDAKKKCQQCLEVGLDNWTVMVANLAREEKAKKEANKGRSSWFCFRTMQEEFMERWESEEGVIRDRMKRARFLLPKNDYDV